MVARLSDLLNQSQRIAFFGGAGVSTESGIPDFRSATGLFTAHSQFGHSPEEILSAPFFDRDPATFYRYYRNHLIHLDAQPNITHTKLAAWEKQGKSVDVITQNIDGLHQLAGSTQVHELHGSIWRNTCQACQQPHTLTELLALFPDDDASIPRCDCGGILKPDVVLYGESLPSGPWERAANALAQAEVLIVAGTSLSVYPAAGMLEWFGGHSVAVINRDPTPADARATMVFHTNLGEVFTQLS